AAGRSGQRPDPVLDAGCHAGRRLDGAWRFPSSPGGGQGVAQDARRLLPPEALRRHVGGEEIGPSPPTADEWRGAGGGREDTRLLLLPGPSLGPLPLMLLQEEFVGLTIAEPFL